MVAECRFQLQVVWFGIAHYKIAESPVIFLFKSEYYLPPCLQYRRMGQIAVCTQKVNYICTTCVRYNRSRDGRGGKHSRNRWCATTVSYFVTDMASQRLSNIIFYHGYIFVLQAITLQGKTIEKIILIISQVLGNFNTCKPNFILHLRLQKLSL